MSELVDELKMRAQTEPEDASHRSPPAIGESTGLRLGLIIAVVVGLMTVLGAIGAFAFGVWQSGRWVGEINTGLQSISMDIKIVKNDQTEIKLRLDGHESRLTKLETAGSPNAQKLAEQLQQLQRSFSDQLAQLQRALDLHLAREPIKP